MKEIVFNLLAEVAQRERKAKLEAEAIRETLGGYDDNNEYALGG